MLPALRSLVQAKRPEPSYPSLPEVSENGETNVPGIYAVGELAGTPLVKLGLNAGHDLVTRLGGELEATRDETHGDALDLLIVGAGSSGFGATLAAHERGLSYLTVEAAAFANTFVTMTKGKWLFAEPTERREPLPRLVRGVHAKEEPPRALAGHRSARRASRSASRRRSSTSRARTMNFHGRHRRRDRVPMPGG